MAQTYTAKFDQRTDLIREDWVYDEGAWVVWSDPSDITDETGKVVRRTMGSPALIVCGHLAEPQALAEKIAALLTEAKV
jgi:hypothetical protein